jgi:hypothetical protein
VVARNLKLVKLYVELVNEVLEQVLIVVHELAGHFLGEHDAEVFLWVLKVGEQQNKDLQVVPRDLSQVDLPLYAVEVSVQHLARLRHAHLIVADVHRWRSPLGNKVNLL